MMLGTIINLVVHNLLHSVVARSNSSDMYMTHRLDERLPSEQGALSHAMHQQQYWIANRNRHGKLRWLTSCKNAAFLNAMTK